MLDIPSLFSYPLNASSTSVQLVNAPGDRLPESFCPWSIRIPVDEETLSMILSVGFKPSMP